MEIGVSEVVLNQTNEIIINFSGNYIFPSINISTECFCLLKRR